MPIQFTCPHCNKQMVVAEQYGGQSGPCQGCGKPITIPLPKMGFAPPQPAGGSGGMTVLAVLGIVALVLLVLCGGGAGTLFFVARSSMRPVQQRLQATNNMKQIALALHNYHDVWQKLPPAVVNDADGKPLYSGRVLLLPYLEQSPLYDAWDKNKAWDSPENLSLSQQLLPVFQHPSDGDNTNACDFLFITGPGTVFDESKPASRFADITDGTSNTIFLAEARGAGLRSWAEPRELAQNGKGATPSGHDPKLILVGYCDGSVQAMETARFQSLVRQLTTRSGGEVIPQP